MGYAIIIKDGQFFGENRLGLVTPTPYFKNKIGKEGQPTSTWSNGGTNKMIVSAVTYDSGAEKSYQSYLYSLVGSPSGLTINPITGTITVSDGWTGGLVTAKCGNKSITLTVPAYVNDGGLTVLDSLVVSVPVYTVNGTSATTTPVYTLVYNGTTYNSTNATVKYELTSDDVADTIVLGTGAITFHQTTTNRNVTVKLTVTKGSLSESKTATVTYGGTAQTVTGGTINTFSYNGLTPNTPTYTFTTNYGNVTSGATLSYSISPTDLYASINPNTGVITNKNTTTSDRTYTVTVTATYGGVSATKTCQVTLAGQGSGEVTVTGLTWTADPILTPSAANTYELSQFLTVNYSDGTSKPASQVLGITYSATSNTRVTPSITGSTLTNTSTSSYAGDTKITASLSGKTADKVAALSSAGRSTYKIGSTSAALATKVLSVKNVDNTTATIYYDGENRYIQDTVSHSLINVKSMTTGTAYNIKNTQYFFCKSFTFVCNSGYLTNGEFTKLNVLINNINATFNDKLHGEIYILNRSNALVQRLAFGTIGFENITASDTKLYSIYSKMAFADNETNPYLKVGDLEDGKTYTVQVNLYEDSGTINASTLAMLRAATIDFYATGGAGPLFNTNASCITYSDTFKLFENTDEYELVSVAATTSSQQNSAINSNEVTSESYYSSLPLNYCGKYENNNITGRVTNTLGYYDVLNTSTAVISLASKDADSGMTYVSYEIEGSEEPFSVDSNSKWLSSYRASYYVKVTVRNKTTGDTYSLVVLVPAYIPSALSDVTLSASTTSAMKVTASLSSDYTAKEALTKTKVILSNSNKVPNFKFTTATGSTHLVVFANMDTLNGVSPIATYSSNAFNTTETLTIDNTGELGNTLLYAAFMDSCLTSYSTTGKTAAQLEPELTKDCHGLCINVLSNRVIIIPNTYSTVYINTRSDGNCPVYVKECIIDQGWIKTY